MADIILHHYPLSPFSEKIRRILAFKNIPWTSVETPITLPKADLTALTGAYRRAPVMQIGADVYCDTALIARRLEELFPEPTILPESLRGAVAVWEDWADNRLVHYVVAPIVVELAEAFPPAFFEDRGDMWPNWSREAFFDAAPHCLAETRHALNALEAQLNVTEFLLGDDFTLADAAVFNPVGFLRKAQGLIPEITARRKIGGWLERIDDFGSSEAKQISGGDALVIAKQSTPSDNDGEPDTFAEYRPGERVSIVADDYGVETLVGEVLRVRTNDITLLRENADLGAVAVHYPRAGYKILKQQD